jgi:hypothetical protein
MARSEGDAGEHSNPESSPKAGTDLVDVQRLLLAFPELKSEEGVVTDQLRRMNSQEEILSRWREIVQAPIEPDEDEGY